MAISHVLNRYSLNQANKLSLGYWPKMACLYVNALFIALCVGIFLLMNGNLASTLVAGRCDLLSSKTLYQYDCYQNCNQLDYSNINVYVL